MPRKPIRAVAARIAAGAAGSLLITALPTSSTATQSVVEGQEIPVSPFVASMSVGVASTAPAYSLAATLGFVVIAINGLQWWSSRRSSEVK